MTMVQMLAAASALLFILIGLVKVAGVPKGLAEKQWTEFYSKWGMSRQQVMLVGLAEWAGSVMLLAFAFGGWPFGVWGAAIHAAVAVGAIRLHTKYGVIMDAAPMMIMLVVSSLILVGWPPRSFY